MTEKESNQWRADAFGALTDAFSNRLGQNPEFATTLQKIVDQTNIRFDSKKNPELLSEKLLGTWVGLAAEHTLLDAKKMPGEADGARSIQLESEVERLEDAIGFAHRGSKKIVVDERLISIIADPTGDTQKRIADSLGKVSKAAARVTVKTLPVIVVGEMLISACTPINPTTAPAPERTPTVELMPALITKDYAMDMALNADFSNMDVSDKKSAEEIMTSLKAIYQESFPETDIANVTGSYVHIKTVSGFDWEVAVSSPYASLSDGGQTALIAFRENNTVKQAHVLWTADERQTDGTLASTLRILELQGDTIIGGNLVFGISERETGGGLIVIANPDNPGDFQVFTTTETSQPNGFLDAFNLLPGSVLAAGEPTPIRLTPTPVFLASETPIPPTETPVPTEALPNYYSGLASEPEQVPDAGSVENVIKIAEYFLSQPPVVSDEARTSFGLGEWPDLSFVQITCENTESAQACAFLATARVEDRVYVIMQLSTTFGPRNLIVYLGGPMAGLDALLGRKFLGRLNALRGQYSIPFFTRIKISEHDNPEAIRWTVGLDDPLPDHFLRLMEGEITPEQELTPIWAIPY